MRLVVKTEHMEHMGHMGHMEYMEYMEYMEHMEHMEHMKDREQTAVHGGPLAHGSRLCGGLEMKMIVFWNRAMIFVGISVAKISNVIIECLTE